MEKKIFRTVKRNNLFGVYWSDWDNILYLQFHVYSIYTRTMSQIQLRGKHEHVLKFTFEESQFFKTLTGWRDSRLFKLASLQYTSVYFRNSNDPGLEFDSDPRLEFGWERLFSSSTDFLICWVPDTTPETNAPMEMTPTRTAAIRTILIKIRTISNISLWLLHTATY